MKEFNYKLKINISTDCKSALTGAIYEWVVETRNHWWLSGTLNNELIMSNSSTNFSYCIVLSVDSNGCFGSAQYMSTPTKLNVGLPDNSIICGQQSTDGDNITGLMAMASGGSPPYTFVWNTPSGATDTTQTPLINNPVAGTYSITLMDAAGNKAFATGNVTIKTPPTISITSTSTTLSAHGSDTLTASGGVTYQWSTGQTGKQIIVNPQTTTVYSVIARDSVGCSANAMSTVSVLSGNNWQPSPDTSRQYRTANYPSIFYGGNVSIGADSVTTKQTPHHTLDVHGGISADSVTTTNLRIKDTISTPILITQRINIPPGDSILHLGDSSIHLYLNKNIIGWSTEHWTFPPENIGGLSIGNGPVIALGLNSIAMGNFVTTAQNANNAIIMGNVGSLPLYTDNNPNSLTVLFNTDVPTFFVGPGTGRGTDGEVGIGTTIPDALLNVACGSTSPNNPFEITNTTKHLPMFKVDPLGNAYFAGNVGILTPPSNYPLDVQGTIHSYEVRVCNTPNCDFVFDKEYNLIGLDSLECYLQLNHHLPGVPSAKEMQEEGNIPLGKMCGQLLQKVEELTLYILQQQKEIGSLQEQMAALKKSK